MKSEKPVICSYLLNICCISAPSLRNLLKLKLTDQENCRRFCESSKSRQSIAKIRMIEIISFNKKEGNKHCLNGGFQNQSTWKTHHITNTRWWFWRKQYIPRVWRKRKKNQGGYEKITICNSFHSGSLYLVGSSLSQALMVSGTGSWSTRPQIVPRSPWLPSVAWRQEENIVNENENRDQVREYSAYVNVNKDVHTATLVACWWVGAVKPLKTNNKLTGNPQTEWRSTRLKNNCYNM